jgi:hypothetical protein
MRAARVLWVVLALASCNAVLGIEEARLRSEDGGTAGDSASSEASSPDGTSSADAPVTDGASNVDASQTDADALANPADGADGAAGGPIDASADVDAALKSTCTLDAPKPASVSTTANDGPTLVYSNGLWGLAWYESSKIKYNAVPSTGSSPLLTADAVVLPDVAGDYATLPRLVPVNDSFLLVVGVLDGMDRSFPAVTRVTPDAGAATSLVEGAVTSNASVPSIIGGVAVDTGATNLVLATRGGAGIPLTGTASLFSSAPAYTKTSTPSSSARATSAAWASTAGVFGVAYLESGIPAVGRIAMYDSSLTPVRTGDFLTNGDVPVTSGAGIEIAMVGTGAHFVVAWVDQRNGSNKQQLWVSRVDATTGAFIDEAVASDENATVRFPRVVYDGNSILVAWIEFVSGLEFRVMYRRFTPELSALEPKAPQSATGGIATPQTGFGLVASAPNEYGFAFTSSNETKQYFKRLTCTGP